LYILAAYEGSVRRDPSASAVLMEQAVRMRRCADDWHLLGANRLDTNQPDKARAAFQNALTIRPYDASTHLSLAECARRLGDTQRAKEHRDKADWLRAYQEE
jgi:Tfp pilus assembly protein PilF